MTMWIGIFIYQSQQWYHLTFHGNNRSYILRMWLSLHCIKKHLGRFSMKMQPHWYIKPNILHKTVSIHLITELRCRQNNILILKRLLADKKTHEFVLPVKWTDFHVVFDISPASVLLGFLQDFTTGYVWYVFLYAHMSVCKIFLSIFWRLCDE